MQNLLLMLAIAIGVLLGLVFRRPLGQLWRRLTGDFRREQELQKLGLTHEHGHFYLTIAKYDREMPPIDCFEEDDGTRTFVWDGNEFDTEDAANFARRTAVLAAARAFYGDIDVWTKSLPPPPRPRYRRRR